MSKAVTAEQTNTSFLEDFFYPTEQRDVLEKKKSSGCCLLTLSREELKK